MATYAPTSSAYRDNAVLTAPPGRLVVMLFDGARRFLLQAVAASGAGEHGVAVARIGRAEAIVDELLTTLDMDAGGEVAQNLAGIYVFVKRLLAEARSARDVAKLETAMELLGDLRDAFDRVAATAPAIAGTHGVAA